MRPHSKSSFSLCFCRFLGMSLFRGKIAEGHPNWPNMAPRWPPDGPWEPLGGLLGGSWEPPGGLLGASCGLLGASWGPLGRLLGPLGGFLGASWRHLGPSAGGPLSKAKIIEFKLPLRCDWEPSWGCVLGQSWGPLGALLGPSWGHLGAILGLSWAILPDLTAKERDAQKQTTT